MLIVFQNKNEETWEVYTSCDDERMNGYCIGSRPTKTGALQEAEATLLTEVNEVQFLINQELEQ